MVAMPKIPEISVVIPAINEEHYITEVLDALDRQSFKDFETIVVDGGSSDRTAEIAAKHARVVIQLKRGMSLARNTGSRAARGRILLFLDADTVPSHDLLSAYSKAFSDDRVVAATGPLEPLEKTSLFVRFAYMLEAIYLTRLSFILGRPAISACNFAVRRDAFESVNGFDEKLLTYEGHDLSGRLRAHGRFVYVSGARVKTSVRRVVKWGVRRYVAYRIKNTLRIHLTGKPYSEYDTVR